MVKKGIAAVPQILVKWSTLPDDCATWEDYYVMQTRFPQALIWEVASSPGGASGTPRALSSACTDNQVQGLDADEFHGQ